MLHKYAERKRHQSSNIRVLFIYLILRSCCKNDKDFISQEIDVDTDCTTVKAKKYEAWVFVGVKYPGKKKKRGPEMLGKHKSHKKGEQALISGVTQHLTSETLKKGGHVVITHCIFKGCLLPFHSWKGNYG